MIERIHVTLPRGVCVRNGLTSGGFKLYVEADYEAVTGRVSQVRMPSFGAPVTIDYIYAGYGETERVDFNGSAVWEALERDDPLRRATKEMRGDLMQVERNYDEQTHQLRSYLAHTPAETILDRGSYQYDDEGRLKQVIDVRENSLERYDYDDRGRLTDWHRNATHVEYEYDAIGNQEVGAFGSRTYGAGSAGPHAMTAMGSATTTYDSAGRREANSKGWSADYTVFNLPTHIVNEDGEWRTFEYDAFNQRSVEERSDNTRIVRMGEALILTRTSPAKHSTITYPIQVEGERVAEITHQAYDGQFTHRFLNSDGVGSSLASSDGNGDRVAAPVVEPFGAVMNGSADSYQFATHDFDPQMNLVNANGRIYDPTSAAFLTPDPVRMPTQMGMNLYDYAAADPVNLYDPTGFYTQDGDGGGVFGGWSTPWAQARTRFLGPVGGSAFIKPSQPAPRRRRRALAQAMQLSPVHVPLLTQGLSLRDLRAERAAASLGESELSFWDEVAAEAQEGRAATSEFFRWNGPVGAVNNLFVLGGLAGKAAAHVGMQTPFGMVRDIWRATRKTYQFGAGLMRGMPRFSPGRIGLGNYSNGRFGFGSAFVGRLLFQWGAAKAAWESALFFGSYPSAALRVLDRNPPALIRATRRTVQSWWVTRDMRRDIISMWHSVLPGIDD